METGIYAGISNEDYHAGPGISKSGLDLVARSPLHYWQGYLNPRRDQREETAAMRLGTAIHTMILEPDTFRSRYALIPAEAPRRPTVTQLNAKKPSEDTLTAIAWWEEFDARNADKTIISADDYATVQAIAVGVWGSPLAKAIFKGGVAEQSVFWTDPETGVLCKCRPDWLCEPNPNYAILDLKSAADAGPDGFMRSAYNYGYHRAAAWYLDGVEAAAGMRPDSFMFLAVEKDAPYASAFYYADDAMIELGRRENRRLLRTYADCLAADKWPGYPQKLLPLGLPRWAEVALDGDDQ